MVRTHGWGGRPPATDDEAIDRILAATKTCVDRRGGRTTATDIAAQLCVTRQTVYRYFASTEALLVAFAMQQVGGFLDRLRRHVGGIADPIGAIVAGIVFTIEQLPDEPYAGVLLDGDRAGAYARITSETAITFGRTMLDQIVAAPTLRALDDDAVDELVEWNLRVLQSLLLDAGDPPRGGETLRRYLDRWLVPTLRLRLGISDHSLTNRGSS